MELRGHKTGHCKTDGAGLGLSQDSCVKVTVTPQRSKIMVLLSKGKIQVHSVEVTRSQRVLT